MSLFIHPAARVCEEWWRAHGGRHDDPEWQRYLLAERDYMTAKHVELGEAHDNQGRFGMSKAGGCTRAASLALLGAEAEQLSGSTRVTFRIGHLLECIALATLDCAYGDITKTQAPVEIPPFMSSSMDGIITLPNGGGRAIVSAKSSSYKSSSKGRSGEWIRRAFAALPMDGVRASQPGWWAQSQAEMHGSGISQCLVFVVAKDMQAVYQDDPVLAGANGSLTFAAELLRYDEEWCLKHLLPAWRDAWMAYQDGKPAAAMVLGKPEGYVTLPEPGLVDPKNIWGGPNQKATGNYNPCGKCPYLKPCRPTP